MPVPPAYAACRTAAPIVSASCGAPVTSTALLNVTVATIVSPRSKVSPTGGEPKTRPLTPGGPWLASTLWAAAFAIACAPRPSAALVDVPLRIVPPLSDSALAPTPIPSESASPTSTV